MFDRLLFRVTAQLRCRLIDSGGAPYMERYRVGSIGGVTVHLHRYVGPDGDRNVHDHPWSWAVGIPLSGGYEEERLVEPGNPAAGLRRRRVRRFRPNWIRGSDFHRISRTERGTWTLFLHGERTKGWGFLSGGGGGDGNGYHSAGPHREWWKTAPLGADAGREPLVSAAAGGGIR